MNDQMDWLLSLPKETKLNFIDSALKEGNAGMALSIAKLFLDAPITKGGISSDEINKVFEKNNSI
jgi:hypothetical protein